LKIAYIVNEDISKHSGVVSKIRSQTAVWEKTGHDVKVFTLSARGTISLLENGIIIGHRVPGWGVRKLLSYFQKMRQLKKQLNDFGPDVVYLRYFFYFPGMLSILRKHAPFIFEINSNDVNEYKKRFKKYQLYNLLTRGILFGNADGFISVSHELEIDPDFSKYKRPSVVIGNGIDVHSVDKRENDGVDPDQPMQAVFIGSPNKQFWHGLDKVIYLAKKIPDVIFHIIGPDIEHMIQIDARVESMENVKAHGYLGEDESQAIVKTCDVGISTLSLYLKGMEEASPLKSRQYLAQGIPIIIGYKDTDLPGMGCPFVLSIGNYEGNVKDNLAVIEKFILSSREFDVREIQSFALEHLDYAEKEILRLNFFQAMLQQHEARRGCA